MDHFQAAKARTPLWVGDRAILAALIGLVASCVGGPVEVEQPTSITASSTTVSAIVDTTTSFPVTTTATLPPGGDPTDEAWSTVEAERHVTNFLAALAGGAYEQAAWSADNNGVVIEGQAGDETPAEALQRQCGGGSCAGLYAVHADGPGIIDPDSYQASSTITVMHLDTGVQETIHLATFEGQLIIAELPPLVPSGGGPTLVELLFGTNIPRRVVVERFEAFEIWEDGESERVTNWWAGDAVQIEGDALADFRTVVGLRDPRPIYEGDCIRLMTRGDEVVVLEQCDTTGWSMFVLSSGEAVPTPIPFEERFDGEYVWFAERADTVVHGIGDAEGNLVTLTTLEGVDVLGDDYGSLLVLSTDGALVAYVDHRDPAAISYFWSPVVVVKDASSGSELGRWTLDNPVMCLEFAETWLVACEADRDSVGLAAEQVALVAMNVETGQINRVDTPTRIFLPT